MYMVLFYLYDGLTHGTQGAARKAAPRMYRSLLHINMGLFYIYIGLFCMYIGLFYLYDGLTHGTQGLQESSPSCV